MQLLDIRNLTLEIDTPSGVVRAVDRVSMQLKEGEFRGLVGESGSGKSLIAKAIIGALDERWKVSADRLYWRGQDMLRISPEERKAIINRDFAMIFQEPSSCLDPTTKISEQLKEAVPSDQLSGYFWQKQQQRLVQAEKLLHKVGIKQHQHILNSYPYELSEGLCQKVMIAMAIARQPLLLIADEPTTAMEGLTQSQIFRLLAKLNQLKNMTMLLISHDLSLITDAASTVTVLYCGQAVESGNIKQVFSKPLHPYTHALLQSTPAMNPNLMVKTQLQTLPGSIPPLQHLPVGCRLGPRCPNAQKECVKAPAQQKMRSQTVSCHFPRLKG